MRVLNHTEDDVVDAAQHKRHRIQVAVPDDATAVDIRLGVVALCMDLSGDGVVHVYREGRADLAGEVLADWTYAHPEGMFSSGYGNESPGETASRLANEQRLRELIAAEAVDPQ